MTGIKRARAHPSPTPPNTNKTCTHTVQTSMLLLNEPGDFPTIAATALLCYDENNTKIYILNCIESGFIDVMGTICNHLQDYLWKT